MLHFDRCYYDIIRYIQRIRRILMAPSILHDLCDRFPQVFRNHRRFSFYVIGNQAISGLRNPKIPISIWLYSTIQNESRLRWCENWLWEVSIQFLFFGIDHFYFFESLSSLKLTKTRQKSRIPLRMVPLNGLMTSTVWLWIEIDFHN